MVKACVPKLSTSARWPVAWSSRSTTPGIVSANRKARPYTTDDPSTATRSAPGGFANV